MQVVSVCVGCGLCCDGALFGHLAVADESDLGAPLRALGVEVIVEADPPVFELPCPAVCDGVCTIYHLHRPRACDLFECDLSSGVLAGTVDETRARAVVADTLTLRERVRAGLAPEDELRAQVRRWFRNRPDDD